MKMNSLSLGAKIRRTVRSRGFLGTLMAILHRICATPSATFEICRDLVVEGKGLEIGGPSQLFTRRGALPLYPLIAGLDNCNFGANTIWEGEISENAGFRYDAQRPLGRQYVAEATSLHVIPPATYDFVLSCHSIEHTSNPMLALEEWKRVLKENGSLLLVVPHKEETCDRHRPVTTLEHLIQDYRQGTGEDDTTHIKEVLELHDLDRDWGVSDFKSFEERSRANLQNRCLHHHVFDTDLVVRMIDYMKFQILSVEPLRPFHIILTARQPLMGQDPNNWDFLSPRAEWRRRSPFRMDRCGINKG